MTVSRKFALTSGLFFALIMSVTAVAANSPAKGMFPKVSTSPGQHCREVFLSAEDACFTKNEAVGTAVGSAMLKAAAGVDGTNEAGGAMQTGGQVSAGLNANAGQVCRRAHQQCVTQCEAATKQLEALNPSVNGAYTAEIGELNRVTKGLCPVFLHQATMYDGSTSQGIAAGAGGRDVKDASSSGNFLKDNWGKIAVGTLGVAAIHNLTKGGDGGGGGQGGGATGSTGAAGTNGAPDCTKDDAAKNLLCDGQLLTECSILANVASTKCTAFTDRHCGFATPAGQVNNAPGLGSKLCNDAMAGRYCKNEAKAKCFSCLSLKDRQSDRCVSNPQGCTHENTTQEMGYFKHSCPDDPVFLDLKWANVIATPLPSNSALPSVTASETNTPVGQPPTNSGELTEDLDTAGREPAQVLKSQSGDGALDTGPRIGVSVFSRSTQTLQILCGQGKLNSCGLRRSIISRRGTSP